MSWQDAKDAQCEGETGCRSIELVIEPRAHELGGLTVRRALPVREKRSVGPFVFFDQMGPDVLAPGQAIDVRPHPHIGLSTLTWLFDGSIMHRDSLGYEQEIKPGEINWMTAGSGIVHSERSVQEGLDQERDLFGLQIWMALPVKDEETDPSFQHYPAEQIPTYEKDGIEAKIVAGSMWGLRSPVSVYSETVYVDIRLSGGHGMTIDAEYEERALYPLEGSLKIDGEVFGVGQMIVLKEGRDVSVSSDEGCHFTLLGGAKLDGKRFMFWNFVSSRRERINQAKLDWKEGRFAKVINDEEEFVPLPEG